MKGAVKRRTSLTAAALVAAVLGVNASVALASPAAAIAAGDVSVAPLHPNKSNPNYFTLNLAPGAGAEDAVVITNGSAEPVSLLISPVDGITGQTSGAIYGNQQDPVREAGRWVTPEVNSLTLQPKSSRTVGFSVRVPQDAGSGDHLAGIAVQNTVPADESNGFGIKQIVRSAIGVEVVVPGPSAFKPSLTSLGISQVGTTGIGAIDVGLGNSGNQLGKPVLRVSVSGPSGYQRTSSRELDTVLPGDTIKYPFAWPDRLAKGRYDITATLTGGGARVTLHRTVQVGSVLAGVAQPTAKNSPPEHAGLQWWAWTLIVLAALGSCAALALRLRGRSLRSVSQH